VYLVDTKLSAHDVLRMRHNELLPFKRSLGFCVSKCWASLVGKAYTGSDPYTTGRGYEGILYTGIFKNGVFTVHSLPVGIPLQGYVFRGLASACAG
jgi:hypothetical protein